MKAKIEQTQDVIVSKIKDKNKESTLIQKTEEDNTTHFIYESKEQKGNITTTKRVEYIF